MIILFILCASQDTEAKTLPADVCVFGRFGRLSPAAVLSADWLFDSRLKWWFHVSSIVTYLPKNTFCCIETVANNALNRRRAVIFYWLWANAAPALTLNTAFSLRNAHAKWWIHCLLTSSPPLLSHPTSIYHRPKHVCGDFCCFQGKLPKLGDLSVQHNSCLYDCV